MKQKIKLPELTNEFEKFDKARFYEEVNPISGKRKEVTDLFYLEEEAQNPGFIVRVYSVNSYFMVAKYFFENGHVERKVISFVNGDPVSFIYQFNEDGKLIETINTDAGYDFSWEAIIEYCEKNKIKLTKGYKEFDGFQTKIYKKEIDSKKVWEIMYQISGDEVLKISLDGKTGKELKREKLEFVNH